MILTLLLNRLNWRTILSLIQRLLAKLLLLWTLLVLLKIVDCGLYKWMGVLVEDEGKQWNHGAESVYKHFTWNRWEYFMEGVGHTDLLKIKEDCKFCANIIRICCLVQLRSIWH